jgi:hypothetical protein
MKWLRHAFAVDPPGPAQPNDAQRQLVDRLCREVIRRRMTTPAHMMLEMGRPLNYMSAQMLHFFQPFMTVLTDQAAYDQLASFLEQRGSIDYISGRLEALEADHAESEGMPGHRGAN